MSSSQSIEILGDEFEDLNAAELLLLQEELQRLRVDVQRVQQTNTCLQEQINELRDELPARVEIQVINKLMLLRQRLNQR